MKQCYIENGNLIDGVSKKVIERPAVLIDVKDDTILKYGEYESVAEKMSDMTRMYMALGCESDLKLHELSELPVNQQCYIIMRMLNYTQSGFVRAFGEKAVSPDAEQWLENEMKRVPID